MCSYDTHRCTVVSFLIPLDRPFISEYSIRTISSTTHFRSMEQETGHDAIGARTG
jgi:hypothetical protein